MKTLCIYIGYTSFLTDFYGTEISIVKLSTELCKQYKIYIVTLRDDPTTLYNEFTYINYTNLVDVKIDILIISRYINYFTYCHLNPKKTYLWIHDVNILGYFQNYSFDNNGRELLYNVLDKIDKIILLSDWHKLFFQHFYNKVPNNKIKIIGNGITTQNFKPLDLSKKIKNRFVWISCLNRGIERMISIFNLIHNEFPDAELHVFRDTIVKEEYIESIRDIPYIYFHGKVHNDTIIEELKKSEYWFYPTTFHETYCISALESQMAGCVTIATDIGSLNTTVGNHGILLSNDLSNDEMAIEVIKIMNNEKLKEETIKKGYEWALKQDWSIIKDEWLKLFNHKKYLIF
jgi:glycosyltransferase involved in cell wall biosynthesis